MSMTVEASVVRQTARKLGIDEAQVTKDTLVPDVLVVAKYVSIDTN